MVEKIKRTVKFLDNKGFKKPEVGVILGTGLGQMIDEIDIIHTIDYEKIPDFPLSTVEFHTGKLIYGKLMGKHIVAMHGRMHYYEGYELDQITFPLRVMKFLGIQHLLISNAGGALNLNIKKGNLMLLEDHINLLPSSPLRGKEYKELGSRFADMCRPYSEELNDKFLDAAKQKKINLTKGIYVGVAGPQLETRAEYRYLRMIGADVVGMSTIPEVIVANQMHLPCAAVSVITDECDPDNLKPVKIEEIIEVANSAEPKLVELFKDVISQL